MVNAQRTGLWIARAVVLEPGAAGASKNGDFGGFLGYGCRCTLD